jgi:glycosyltransferase involved in cell wall biosynthesis
VRILVLATETVLPANSGVRQRMLHLARQLAAVADVEVVALGEPETEADEPFVLRHVGSHRPPLRALPLAIRRTYMEAKLRPEALAFSATQNGWSTVQAEFPYTVAAAARAGVPLVLDAHNVESDALRSLAEDEPQFVHRLRWRWEAAKTAQLERRAVGAADAVCATSDEDAAVLERYGARRLVVVPNGVDTSAVEHRLPARARRLLYIGHFGYRPNVRAAEELVTEVFPRVRESVPDATLQLVGREASHALGRLAGPVVHVAGDVEEVLPHLRAAGAFVVPLRSGGGTRLKVLEAMASGVPVVATRFGVAGLSVRDGEHVLLADSSADLAAATSKLLRDDALARRLSLAARELVERRYDWREVARPLIDLHASLATRA